jgi:hypothetical protein
MFHLIIIIGILIASIRWGEWNRWREFLPTIYFVIIFNLYYQYISLTKKNLWIAENPLLSDFFTDTIYTFIFLSCLTLLFLSHFPETKRGKIIRFARWIIISIIIDIIAVKTNNFSFHNGWNVWWESAFYPLMYTMMYIHYIRPRLAMLLSAIVVICLMAIFDINVF